jgi:hypothetical protein
VKWVEWTSSQGDTGAAGAREHNEESSKARHNGMGRMRGMVTAGEGTASRKCYHDQ